MQRTTIFAASLAVLALAMTPAFGDNQDKMTEVTISQPVQAPGGVVLQPGTYMFILNLSATDHNMVEIKSQNGKHLYAMVFTTRAARTNRTGKTVLNFYEMPAGQPEALRQWFWPGDYDGQEFLYPHKEAVKIDQASNQKAPEISDEEYAKLLNTNDQAAQKENGGPARSNSNQLNSSSRSYQSSETYQQTSTYQAAQPSQSNQSSQNYQAATPADTSANDSQSNETLAQNTEPAAAQSDVNATNSAQDTSLPQTASQMPLAGLIGLVLLAGGATLHFARHSAGQRD